MASRRQGDEGAPPAWLVFEARTGEAIRDLRVDDEIIVITWLDRADRDVLSTRPRDEPDRPVVGLRILVSDMEALDGTPIVDVKPVLGPIEER